jgi:hypothetical protein
VQLIETAIMAAFLAHGTGTQKRVRLSFPPAPVPGAELLHSHDVDSLPELPLVPQWSQMLRAATARSVAGAWELELGSAPATSFDLGATYHSLLRLRPPHGGGGFVQFEIEATSDLSMGPELSWLVNEPPREGYTKTRVLTPGWSIWYELDDAPVAFGMTTGTRFLIADQMEPVVDLLTSEARVAFFLR